MLMRLVFILLLSIGMACSAGDPQPAKPLFRLLSSTESGIDFNNLLKDTREHNILIYSNFYGGAGVGIGDLNNDALPDLFFAGNQVGDRLYLNEGDLSFKDITDQAGIADNGEWSSGVVMGDVNHDGWLDIYVTRELYDDEPLLRKNALYINNGDLTFSDQAEQWGVADTARTRHATFLDFDKDGDLDLFLLNQPPNPGDYSKYYNTELLLPKYGPKLLANQGDHYEDVTAAAGVDRPGFPNSVSTADANNDGWPDLYVANDFWAGDWLYLNNGDGTFTDVIQEQFRHTSFSSMGVDVADINNDGWSDIMVLDMVAEDNYRLKANMSGMNPAAFWKVVNEGGHYQYMFNTLHLNQGYGYSDVAQLAGVASTDWSWSNLIADFDNDGHRDIHVTNGLMRDIRNNDAAKEFAHIIEQTVFEYVQKHPELEEDIGIWDLVDIDKTLAVVPSEKLSNYTFRGSKDLTYANVSTLWGLDQKSFSNGSAYADLDLDGDLDLVVSNINEPAFLYENNSNKLSHANFLRIQPIADTRQVSVLGTKVRIKISDEWRYAEILGRRGMYSSSEEVAHFGLASDSEVEELIVTWPDGRQQHFTDVAPNQLMEVRWSHAQAAASPRLTRPSLANLAGNLGLSYTHEENDFDDYQRQVLLPHRMSTMGPSLAVGDINGDGLDDLFVGGASGQASGLFTQNDDGTFVLLPSPMLESDRIHEDVAAALFDADGDGDRDLYVVSGGNEFPAEALFYRDRLYLNTGAGVFEKSEELPDLRHSGSQVLPHDFDRDGDMDLLVLSRHVPWHYPEPASSVLLRNEGGSFSDVTRELAPDLDGIGMINDGVWFDHDADGLIDFALVGEWTAPCIFKQGVDGRFQRGAESSLQDEVGWWFSIDAADLDLDGDQDLVVGNLGLNYKYRATHEEPFSVYYDDFDGSGKKDIVLAYYNFGEQFPLRGRECSSQQIPAIKEDFENYDLFASSDIEAVYGTDNLSAAVQYHATNFASVWLENTGGGNFRVHQLPTQAQFSSINDMLITDLNADNYPDLVIAGNLYHAEVETARNDAGVGLILLNEAGEGFRDVAPQESGLYVPGNVKSLVSLQSNGEDLWVFGRNGEGVFVLGERGVPARQ